MEVVPSRGVWNYGRIDAPDDGRSRAGGRKTVKVDRAPQVDSLLVKNVGQPSRRVSDNELCAGLNLHIRSLLMDEALIRAGIGRLSLIDPQNVRLEKDVSARWR